MRLIDADDLIKMLEDGVWNDAVKVVNEQPTAYDSTKVMKKLEELSEIEEEKSNDCKEKGATTESLIRCGIAKGYSYSAEIVKAGEINE